jgi:hypothetical protein
VTRATSTVIGMTDTTISQTSRWRTRTTGVALVAALALAAVLGPPLVPATRLGAGDLVGFATVSAADTIISSGVLAADRSVSESD